MTETLDQAIATAIRGDDKYKRWPLAAMIDAKVEIEDLKSLLDIDALAQIIRTVDGNHTLGAGALAEAIVSHFKEAD